MDETNCTFKIFSICFENAYKSESTVSFFGFSEFLAVTAIFVVAYSIADERYKLRIENSRLQFKRLFLFVVGASGLFLISAEAWFALEFPIPKTINNIFYFQASIASLTLLFLGYWLFVAFVSPPKFNASNALKYARNAFRRIAYGNEQAQITVAQELIPSVDPIFESARKRARVRDFEKGGFKSVWTEEAEIAQQLISMLGDPRFCRVVAKQVPALAAEIFHQASRGSARELPLDQFSRNVAGEFFSDPTTAIHYEEDGFKSGLIGYARPVSKELFEHVELVEQLASGAGSPLDPLWFQTDEWGKRNWETYSRCALAFLKARFKKGSMWQHSYATRQICDRIEHMCSDAYLIEDMGEDCWRSLPFQKVEIATSFIGKTLDLLEENKIHGPLKSAEKEHFSNRDIYDDLVDAAFGIFVSVASVRTTEFRNWQLQHNTVWSEFIGIFKDSHSRRIFQSRFQRKLFNEIREMEKYYDYKGARVLSVCLNVMGLDHDRNDGNYKKYRAFHRWLLEWVSNNYLKIVKEVPEVAQYCLSGTISYDEKNIRLVKTYRASLGREPERRYLKLRPILDD